MTIRIAHISDLHFGMQGQSEVWRELSSYLRTSLKPNLVLVTGDIADSPNETNFVEAAKQLRDLTEANIKCYVCPGNHDRHPQGISLDGAPKFVRKSSKLFARLWQRFGPGAEQTSGASTETNPALFDQRFADIGVLVQRGKPEDFGLSTSTGRTNWRIRLLVLDSSEEASYFAQGFVSPHMLATLRQARYAGDDREAPDLVIALVHHHLLPVSALELPGQKKGSLFASTILVNAGTVLETLAEIGTDLVLHGHEHCRHLARFGMVDQPNDLVIIGAASATGADTKHGCSCDQSSFNVIELGDDLSVTLQEYCYSRGAWKPEPEAHRLLGAVEIRRARVLRKLQPGAVLNSRLHRHFIFSPTRDAVIRQVTTNCWLKDSRFSVTTENWSGTPYFMGGTVELTMGQSIELRGQQLMSAVGPWRFQYEQALGTDNTDKMIARRVEHEIIWLAGGVLNQDDLARCPQHMRGPLRSENKEFVETEVTDPLEMLIMSVDLPDGFAPAASDFEVFVRDPAGRLLRHEELTDRLRFTKGNRTVVNVPYPLPGYGYLIVWSVPKAAPVANEFQDARNRLEKIAAKVAEVVQKNIKFVAGSLEFTLGIYIPEMHDDSLSFRLIAHKSLPEPPVSVTPKSNQNPFCSAYWGVPKCHVLDRSGRVTDDDAASGLQNGEYGIFVHPLPSFNRNRMEGQSLGVIRVALIAWSHYSPKKLLYLLDAAVQGCASEMLDLVRD